MMMKPNRSNRSHTYKWLTLLLVAAAMLLVAAGCDKNKASLGGEQSPAASSPSSAPPAQSPASGTASPTPAAPSASPSAGEQPKPTAGNSAQAEPTKEGQMMDCGTLKLTGGGQAASIPLRCVKATYGAEDESHPNKVAPQTPLAALKFELPAGLSGKLAAYWMNTGDNIHGILQLAPVGWISGRAAVGADGSAVLELANPSDPQEFVSYFDNGGCQGCLISNIGTYFPDLKDWAAEQGFPATSAPGYKSHKLLDPHHISYTLGAPAGYEQSGIAYQEHSETGGAFSNQKVQLKSASRDMASAILQFFTFQSS